jgi:5-hydroxyisourate hydrolase
MSSISTHILDTARGCPAAGVPVRLERCVDDQWQLLGQGRTDDDGRNRGLLSGRPLAAGLHRITFEIASYHQGIGVDGFYPRAVVEFIVQDASVHHHVPLLLSPFGYSTYRGS